MASNSKRNTTFPGRTRDFLTRLDRSLASSSKLSSSKLSNRDRGESERSRRPSAISKDTKYICQSAQREPELIPVWEGSPRKTYDAGYRLELGLWVTVAAKKPLTKGEIVAVRSILGPDIDKDLTNLAGLQIVCLRA